jgi:hypothetical protein
MFLRAKATLVCVGMPAGTALLNVPLVLLIARVRFQRIFMRVSPLISVSR